jgi:hypothetical protein
MILGEFRSSKTQSRLEKLARPVSKTNLTGFYGSRAENLPKIITNSSKLQMR